MALKGNIPWNKGKKDCFSEETRRKISETLKGNIPWNKGIPRSEETKRKISLANTGKKHTEEDKKKMSISILKRKSELGYINSPETRRKISLANKGKKHSEETKKKMSVRMTEARKTIIVPKKDTLIEVKIQNYLKQLNVDFFTHQYMNDIEHGYQCDIFIPAMDLIIECDGDYWHKYPVGNEIDHIRTKELIEQGFKVLRLWEHEIKEMDIHKFKEKLKAKGKQ